MKKENKDHKWQAVMDEVSSEALHKGQRLASILPLLGHVSLLYSQVETHKHFTVGELETRVLPPILSEQSKLYIQSGSGGLPMGYVSWALLSSAKEQQYLHTKRLGPSDWNSGDRVWLVDLLLPYGGQMRIFNELQHQRFKDKEVNIFVVGAKGEMQHSTLRKLLAAKAALSKDEMGPKQSFLN